MRTVDIPLWHITDIVATCIVLHIMCMIETYKFDMKLIEEAKRELNRRIDNKLLRKKQEMKVELTAIGEVKNINITKNGARITKNVNKYFKFFLINFF